MHEVGTAGEGGGAKGAPNVYLQEASGLLNNGLCYLGQWNPNFWSTTTSCLTKPSLMASGHMDFRCQEGQSESDIVLYDPLHYHVTRKGTFFGPFL